MKKLLKTISLMLAAVLACLPLASVASADFVPGYHPLIHVRYRRVDPSELELGKAYVFVASNEIAENQQGTVTGYALTANETSRRLSATRVDIEDGIVIDGGVEDYGETCGKACTWEVVDREGKFCLRNSQTKQYLGSFFGLYTWDSMEMADILYVTPTGFDLSYYDSMGYLYTQTLQFDESTNSFSLRGEGGAENIYIFEKHVQIFG